jgi:hypothetical protein
VICAATALAQYLAPHPQQSVQARRAGIRRESLVSGVENFERRATVSRLDVRGMFAARMAAQELFAQRQPLRGVLLFIRVSRISGALFLPRKRLPGPLARSAPDQLFEHLLGKPEGEAPLAYLSRYESVINSVLDQLFNLVERQRTSVLDRSRHGGNRRQWDDDEQRKNRKYFGHT